MSTVYLLGKNEGELKDLADISIIIPSKNTLRIQEAYIMIVHIICEEIEKSFK
ncbi:MAG: hypothetical protein U9O20_00410 [Patescibacteria group bacterium]|nr:hypothetical protein [Patescibacteria group bacterium]